MGPKSWHRTRGVTEPGQSNVVRHMDTAQVTDSIGIHRTCSLSSLYLVLDHGACKNQRINVGLCFYHMLSPLYYLAWPFIFEVGRLYKKR